jgi:hypothetical protein
MENDVYKNEVIDEVGYLAKLIDEEMTIFERMKIKKSTFKRITLAILIYISVIVFLYLFL